ncbi:MAG: hybrid sensor histidine kinase/response regulator [Pseudomonadales bacterium]|nr:hybrid sensor histidine kinase/response regulator [Pseudomonadales bacterium]
MSNSRKPALTGRVERSSARGSVHKLLVVDDDARNVALLVRILKRAGYHAEGVYNGEDALNVARVSRPDLILLDVLMPGMDGYETCELLKSEPILADTPVLFISGQSESTGRLQAFEAGGLDYITKPFDGREVLARVKAHLDIRDLQSELRSRNEKLQAYNRRLKELESHRDELVSMVVHDMRSPITVVNSTLKLLEVELASHGDPEIVEDIQIAKKNAGILSKMVEQMLHISRLESGSMELDLASAQIQDVIETVVKANEVAWPEITFDMGLDAADVSVVMDADIIKRVLDNLVSNAASFYTAGSRVAVELCTRYREIIVTVADNGPGVPDELQEKIFDKFHRGLSPERRDKSIGLGLAFCKLAVEAHGGSIGIDSEVGSGSRFWFSLPLRK